MKAILEFDDDNELRLAINGGKYWSCLWDLDQDLRTKLKHEVLSDDEICLLEFVRQFIHDRIDMEEIE